MVFPFALLVVGGLALIAGFTGRSLGQVLRGTLGDRSGWIFGIPLPEVAEREPAAGDTSSTSLASYGGSASASGGARGIVSAAADVAHPYGTYVVSDSRPGSTTSSGNSSDHSSNDANRAARDIAVQGIDAINGPPSPRLDQAVVAIGAMFGRKYKPGVAIVDTFNWQGFRIQIIWRTPAYGGHMGHIHVGARKN